MRTSRRVRRLLESVSPYAEVEDLCEIDGKLRSDHYEMESLRATSDPPPPRTVIRFSTFRLAV